MKELKEALSFALALGNALGQSLEDGKLDYSDLLNLWEPMTKAGDAVEGASKILAEIHALDDAATRELLDYAKATFDIPQDKMEAAVEASINVLLGILKLVTIFKEQPK